MDDMMRETKATYRLPATERGVLLATNRGAGGGRQAMHGQLTTHLAQLLRHRLV
jgi:hypothetical protein